MRVATLGRHAVSIHFRFAGDRSAAVCAAGPARLTFTVGVHIDRAGAKQEHEGSTESAILTLISGMDLTPCSQAC